MFFKDIKGQDRPIAVLRQAFLRSSIPGAYLFIGEDGLGKYLVALNFAKAVNCLNGDFEPCETCPSCLKINKKQHPDVHFIEPEDSEAIKIDAVRGLKKDIALRPYDARKKVFIINDAHNLTPDASNAILKILEEPPRDSLIILISAKPALLLKTIISRCQILRFNPLERGKLEGILENDYRVGKGLAHFLAYFCEGRIGPALRLKDTDILREKNRVIDGFLISGKGAFLDSAHMQERQGLRSALNILAAWFRDIYIAKAGVPHSKLINLDRKEELLKFMARYNFMDLNEIINSISNSLLYLEYNINTKLLLYNLKAELCKR